MYTIEDFQTYGNWININTAINCIINGTAAYIVYKNSTKAMEIYKFYILLTIFCAFFMDFHISFIFGPFIMLPATIMCGAGLISRNFDYVWGQMVPSGMMHINVSTVGFSIIYSLLYQYYSLKGSTEFLHKPFNIAFAIFFMIMYPFPSYFLCCLASNYESSKAYVQQNFPDSFDLFLIAPCQTVVMELGGKTYYLVLVGQVMTAVLIAYFIAFLIHRDLGKMAGILSKSTLKARKQFLVALVLQLTVPSLLMVIPVIFMIICVLAGIMEMKVMSNFMIPMMAFHSSANAITVLLVITPYRNVLKKWFCQIFFRNSRLTLVSPQNSNHLTTQIFNIPE